MLINMTVELTTDSTMLKPTTVELLIKHIYCFIKTSIPNSSKGGNGNKNSSANEKLLFEKTMTRLAILVGDLSRIEYNL